MLQVVKVCHPLHAAPLPAAFQGVTDEGIAQAIRVLRCMKAFSGTPAIELIGAAPIGNYLLESQQFADLLLKPDTFNPTDAEQRSVIGALERLNFGHVLETAMRDESYFADSEDPGVYVTSSEYKHYRAGAEFLTDLTRRLCSQLKIDDNQYFIDVVGPNGLALLTQAEVQAVVSVDERGELKRGRSVFLHRLLSEGGEPTTQTALPHWRNFVKLTLEDRFIGLALSPAERACFRLPGQDYGNALVDSFGDILENTPWDAAPAAVVLAIHTLNLLRAQVSHNDLNMISAAITYKAGEIAGLSDQVAERGAQNAEHDINGRIRLRSGMQVLVDGGPWQGPVLQHQPPTSRERLCLGDSTLPRARECLKSTLETCGIGKVKDKVFSKDDSHDVMIISLVPHVFTYRQVSDGRTLAQLAGLEGNAVGL